MLNAACSYSTRATYAAGSRCTLFIRVGEGRTLRAAALAGSLGAELAVFRDAFDF